MCNVFFLHLPNFSTFDLFSHNVGSWTILWPEVIIWALFLTLSIQPSTSKERELTLILHHHVPKSFNVPKHHFLHEALSDKSFYHSGGVLSICFCSILIMYLLKTISINWIKLEFFSPISCSLMSLSFHQYLSGIRREKHWFSLSTIAGPKPLLGTYIGYLNFCKHLKGSELFSFCIWKIEALRG